MPIPIGVLAQAGAGGAAGGYQLIATSIGTGSSGTITFSNIPSTFTHLELRYTAVCNAGQSGSLRLDPNSDTTTIKPLHRLEGNGGSVSSSGFTNQDRIVLGGVGEFNNTFHIGVLSILDYNATKNKTFRSLVFDNGNVIQLVSNLWINTNAITSLTVSLSASASFSNLSRFSLYGVS